MSLRAYESLYDMSLRVCKSLLIGLAGYVLPHQSKHERDQVMRALKVCIYRSLLICLLTYTGLF